MLWLLLTMVRAAAGYQVDILDYNWQDDEDPIPITYDLIQGYDVFVMPTPMTDFADSELSAIQQFVNEGGGLFLFTTLTEVDDDDPDTNQPLFADARGVFFASHPIMAGIEEFGTFELVPSITVIPEPATLLLLTTGLLTLVMRRRIRS